LAALFHGLGMPGVSDAMDKLGSPGQCLGIAPLETRAAKEATMTQQLAQGASTLELMDLTRWRKSA
jgi:hypothetical protein